MARLKKVIKIKAKPIKRKSTMTKNEKEIVTFKKWFENKVKEILGEMVLDFVDLKIIYVKNDLPIDENSNAVFTINYIKRYRQSAMNVYPQAFELYHAKEIKTLTDGLVHELTHMHTIPFVDLARDRYTSEKELMDGAEEITEIFSEYIRRYIGQKKNNKIYNN